MSKPCRSWFVEPWQSSPLPRSPLGWLPDAHLVFFLPDVVQSLGISAIQGILQRRDTRGGSARGHGRRSGRAKSKGAATTCATKAPHASGGLSADEPARAGRAGQPQDAGQARGPTPLCVGPLVPHAGMVEGVEISGGSLACSAESADARSIEF